MTVGYGLSAVQQLLYSHLCTADYVALLKCKASLTNVYTPQNKLHSILDSDCFIRIYHPFTNAQATFHERFEIRAPY